MLDVLHEVVPLPQAAREDHVAVAHIVEMNAVDGVHLDYVRHCDVILPRGLWERYDLVQDIEHPEFDFCYCGGSSRVHNLM